jgi:serine/threonine protein kinase
MHRDIKPSNILCFNNNIIKLCDFGLAKQSIAGYNTTHSRNVVTVPYRAPEVILTNGYYNHSVDIWSVGVILLEMILGDLPLTGGSEIDQLFKIFDTIGTPSETTWSGLHDLAHWKHTFPKLKGKLYKIVEETDIHALEYDLLTQLLTWPTYRINAVNALKHPYLHHIHKPHPLIHPRSTTYGHTIQHTHRNELFHWMWQLYIEFSLQPATLLTACNICDNFCYMIERIDLQLYVLSCLDFAIKLI